MSINVSNDGVPDLKVSINKWGDSGNTDYFHIATGTPESWDRTDSRGFVMAVIRNNGHPSKYYVLANNDVTISNHDVKRDGKETHPLT